MYCGSICMWSNGRKCFRKGNFMFYTSRWLFYLSFSQGNSNTYVEYYWYIQHMPLVCLVNSGKNTTLIFHTVLSPGLHAGLQGTGLTTQPWQMCPALPGAKTCTPLQTVGTLASTWAQPYCLEREACFYPTLSILHQLPAPWQLTDHLYITVIRAHGYDFPIFFYYHCCYSPTVCWCPDSRGMCI